MLTRFALLFMLLAYAAAPASAQVTLGWPQHTARYGAGYVGNVPNTVPMTSYYRAPTIPAYGQPVTTMYAPAASAAAVCPPATGVVQANYAPGVSYRVGTPNAAAYTSAYSPIVTLTTPYAANWQYPPQTVMPTVANYAPAGYANYAPVPPTYTTNYARTPVTAYRPVTVMSPVGVQQTVLQPCSGYECQAQRKPQGFFSWLFHQNQTPPTAVNYGGCASGYCAGQPAPLSTPYYTPGPVPLGSGGVSVPANVAPSLGSPLPLSTSPAIGGSTTITPNTGIMTAPPSQINSSGGQRADYPPAADAYCPSGESFRPNVSPPSSIPTVPLSPVTPSNDGTPADFNPTLRGPANAPIGSGVQPSAPVDDGARSQFRPPYNVETQQPPRAVIRPNSNITPIPDPEADRGTRAKVNKAPQLLTPTRDRTAQAPADARLAGFEQPAPVVKPTPGARKVLGDEIWRSAK